MAKPGFPGLFAPLLRTQIITQCINPSWNQVLEASREKTPSGADSNWGWLAHGGCTTSKASIRKCSCRALETIYLFSVASTLTIAVCMPVALGWPQRSAVSLLLLWIPASHWKNYGLLNLIVFLFVCFCFIDIYIYIYISTSIIIN